MRIKTCRRTFISSLKIFNKFMYIAIDRVLRILFQCCKIIITKFLNERYIESELWISRRRWILRLLIQFDLCNY